MNCSLCKIDQEVENFEKGRRQCKECRHRLRKNHPSYINQSEWAKKYYLKYPEKRNKERIRIYYHNWYIKNGRVLSDINREALLQWKKDNPEKVKAHALVGTAIKDGRIIKPIICSNCKLNKKLNAHHFDYSNPLDVTWLCVSCHRSIH